MADFFKDQQPEVPVEPVKTEEEPSKVKVGEKEYSQDELSSLVGLGQIAREAETKYGRSVEKFWPEYTKSQQELKELRDKVGEFEKFQQRLKGEEERVDPEVLKQQAIEQAKGLGLLTAEEARQIAREERQAERILEEIDVLQSEAKESGKPNVDARELLEYMQQEGLRSPSVAYKLRYENELEAWKTDQLNKVKQPDFQTQSTSTAGSKQPPTEREPLNKNNIGDRIRDLIAARQGQGQ